MQSLTSALDGGEWSVSRPDHFTPRERAPSTSLVIFYNPNTPSILYKMFFCTKGIYLKLLLEVIYIYLFI
jgi:hypothetical protein